MSRTKEWGATYQFFGYNLGVEHGYADDIDTGIGVGVSGGYLALYNGNDITHFYDLVGDLNFSSEVANDINALQNVLDGYFMVGVDDPSVSWPQIQLDNDTLKLDVGVTGAFTLFSGMKAPHIGNRDYLNFTIEYGWTLNIDWDEFLYYTSIVLAAILLLTLGYLIIVFGAAAVASYASFGFFLRKLGQLVA